jgi:hypothetical protein
MNMSLKHLNAYVPAFLDELNKHAGIKEDLKAGTKKVLTAIKAVPGKANDLSLRAAAKVHQIPGGNKIMAHGPDVLRKVFT